MVLFIQSAGALSFSGYSSGSRGPAPSTVELQCGSSDITASYHWDFGDGSISTESTVFHTYQNPGTYTATCTVEYTEGAVRKTHVYNPPSIIVLNPVVGNFQVTPSSGMTPLTVQFTDTSSNSPSLWTWNFEDGSSSTNQNPSHIFTNPDCQFAPLTKSYTVKLTACNSDLYPCDKTLNPSACIISAPDGYWRNCGVKTSSIVVSNPPSPAVPVSAFTATPESGAAPLTVQFTDTSSNNPTAWTWNFGDGSTSSIQNPSHRYTISGVYSVTLQASIHCLQGNLVTKTITVGSPILPITSTSTTTATTASTTVTTPSPTATTSTTTTTRITIVPTTSLTTVPTTSQTTITTVTPKPTATVNYSATIAAMQSQIAEQNARITEQGNILDQIMTFLRNVFGWK